MSVFWNGKGLVNLWHGYYRTPAAQLAPEEPTLEAASAIIRLDVRPPRMPKKKARKAA